jgi:hypothetical protein
MIETSFNTRNMKSTRLIFAIATLMLIVSKVYSQAPSWQWAFRFGGSNSNLVDVGKCVTRDLQDNIYVAGFFEGNLTLGNYTLSPQGAGDYFVAKFDSLGNILWAKNAGGSSFYADAALGIATDLNGNVLVTGFFIGTMNIGSYTLIGDGSNADMFIVKYDSAGNLLWANSAVGAYGYDVGNSIVADASGCVYVTGRFASPSLSFGTATLINAGGNDMFIVKYDTSGNVLWVRNSGTLDAASGNCISIDQSGNVVVTGSFSGSPITLGTITLQNNGSSDMFVAKYDSNGNVIWAKAAGGTSGDEGIGLACDFSGNVYIAGTFESSTIGFSTTSLNNNGISDVFIAKFDSNGNPQWAKSIGGTLSESANAVAVDPIGNAYLIGNFSSPTISVGSTNLTNSGGMDDIVMAKYDPTGNVIWSMDVGGAALDDANGIICLTNGSVCLTGGFSSPSISFGNFNLVKGPGAKDLFVSKLGTSITGVTENIDKIISTIAPNPANNNITVTWAIPNVNTLTLSDATGRAVRTYNVSGTQAQLSLEGLASGVYFLSVNGEDKAVQKIIKQ